MRKRLRTWSHGPPRTRDHQPQRPNHREQTGYAVPARRRDNRRARSPDHVQGSGDAPLALGGQHKPQHGGSTLAPSGKWPTREDRSLPGHLHELGRGAGRPKNGKEDVPHHHVRLASRSKTKQMERLRFSPPQPRLRLSPRGSRPPGLRMRWNRKGSGRSNVQGLSFRRNFPTCAFVYYCARVMREGVEFPTGASVSFPTRAIEGGSIIRRLHRVTIFFRASEGVSLSGPVSPCIESRGLQINMSCLESTGGLSRCPIVASPMRLICVKNA